MLPPEETPHSKCLSLPNYRTANRAQQLTGCHRIWLVAATLYSLEITGGQNFGERLFPRRLLLMLRLCEWLEQIPWIVTITNSAVLISLVWLVHYLGFFLLVGITVVVDLRVLGVAARNHKLAPLAGQLFPWAWTGLGLVIASGFIMFAGQATTFYPEAVFQIKMGIVLLALVFGVIVQRKSPVWDRDPSMPAAAKWLALLSLALWIGAILAGLEVPAFIPGI
jgi:hypothetical protein